LDVLCLVGGLKEALRKVICYIEDKEFVVLNDSVMHQAGRIESRVQKMISKGYHLMDTSPLKHRYNVWEDK